MPISMKALVLPKTSRSALQSNRVERKLARALRKRASKAFDQAKQMNKRQLSLKAEVKIQDKNQAYEIRRTFWWP